MYKAPKLCDCCKKEVATNFYKEYVNGQLINIALCDKCSKTSNIEEHYNVFLSSLFDDFFQPTFGYVEEARPKKTCKCGCTEEDILQSGRFGCSECYKTFSNLVNVYVNKLGGKTYAGKMPEHVISKNVKVPSIEDRINELKQKMNSAAKAENYALAKQYQKELEVLISKRG